MLNPPTPRPASPRAPFFLSLSPASFGSALNAGPPGSGRGAIEILELLDGIDASETQSTVGLQPLMLESLLLQSGKTRAGLRVSELEGRTEGLGARGPD